MHSSSDFGTVYRKPQVPMQPGSAAPTFASITSLTAPPPPPPVLLAPPPPPLPGVSLAMSTKGSLSLAQKLPEDLTQKDLDSIIKSFGSTDFEAKKWVAEFMKSARQRAEAFTIIEGLSRSDILKTIIMPADFEKAALKEILPQEIIDNLPDFDLLGDSVEKTRLIDAMTLDEFSNYLHHVLIFRDLKSLARKITFYQWEAYAKKLENKMGEDSATLAGHPKNNPIFRDFEKKHKDLIEELQKVDIFLKTVFGETANILSDNPNEIGLDKQTLGKFSVRIDSVAKGCRLKLEVAKTELVSFVEKMGHLRRSQLLSRSRLEALQGKTDPVSLQVQEGLQDSIDACARHVQQLLASEQYLISRRDELTAQVDLLDVMSSYYGNTAVAMNAINSKVRATPKNPKLALLGAAAVVSDEEKRQLEINEPKYIDFLAKNSLYTDEQVFAIWFSLRKNMLKENQKGKKLWQFFFDEEYLLETMVEPEEIRRFLKEKVFTPYFKTRLPHLVALFADKKPREVLSAVVGGDIITVFNPPPSSKVAVSMSPTGEDRVDASELASETGTDITDTQGLSQEVLAILQGKTQREQRELLDATQRLEELQARLQKAEAERQEALLFAARSGPKILTREQMLALPDQELLQLEAKQLVDLGRDVLEKHLSIKGLILEKMAEYWKENQAGFRAMSDTALQRELMPVVQKVINGVRRK